LELYDENNEPISPGHDVYNDAPLRWFCAEHAMDWMELEPDCELIPLTAERPLSLACPVVGIVRTP
jgi:hypothetical protein